MKKFARWYLTRSGYVVLPLGFSGIVLGNCIASGTRTEMTVSNPSGHYIALNHSIVTFQVPDGVYD